MRLVWNAFVVATWMAATPLAFQQQHHPNNRHSTRSLHMADQDFTMDLYQKAMQQHSSRTSSSEGFRDVSPDEEILTVENFAQQQSSEGRPFLPHNTVDDVRAVPTGRSNPEEQVDVASKQYFMEQNHVTQAQAQQAIWEQQQAFEKSRESMAWDATTSRTTVGNNGVPQVQATTPVPPQAQATPPPPKEKEEQEEQSQQLLDILQSIEDQKAQLQALLQQTEAHKAAYAAAAAAAAGSSEPTSIAPQGAAAFVKQQRQQQYQPYQPPPPPAAEAPLPEVPPPPPAAAAIHNKQQPFIPPPGVGTNSAGTYKSSTTATTAAHNTPTIQPTIKAPPPPAVVEFGSQQRYHQNNNNKPGGVVVPPHPEIPPHQQENPEQVLRAVFGMDEETTPPPPPMGSSPPLPNTVANPYANNAQEQEQQVRVEQQQQQQQQAAAANMEFRRQQQEEHAAHILRQEQAHLEHLRQEKARLQQPSSSSRTPDMTDAHEHQARKQEQMRREKLRWEFQQQQKQQLEQQQQQKQQAAAAQANKDTNSGIYSNNVQDNVIFKIGKDELETETPETDGMQSLEYLMEQAMNKYRNGGTTTAEQQVPKTEQELHYERMMEQANKVKNADAVKPPIGFQPPDPPQQQPKEEQQQQQPPVPPVHPYHDHHHSHAPPAPDAMDAEFFYEDPNAVTKQQQPPPQEPGVAATNYRPATARVAPPPPPVEEELPEEDRPSVSMGQMHSDGPVSVKPVGLSTEPPTSNLSPEELEAATEELKAKFNAESARQTDWMNDMSRQYEGMDIPPPKPPVKESPQSDDTTTTSSSTKESPRQEEVKQAPPPPIEYGEPAPAHPEEERSYPQNRATKKNNFVIGTATSSRPAPTRNTQVRHSDAPPPQVPRKQHHEPPQTLQPKPQTRPNVQVTGQEHKRGPVKTSFAEPPPNFSHLSKKKKSVQRKESVQIHQTAFTGYSGGGGGTSSNAPGAGGGFIESTGGGGGVASSSMGFHKSQYKDQMDKAMQKFLAKQEAQAKKQQEGGE